MLKKESLFGKEREDESSPLDTAIGVAFAIVAFVLCVMVVVKTYWLKPFIVSGSSMVKTLSHGDWILADSLAEPKIGDVVVVVNRVKKINVVKRVIGLPGDTVYYDENGFLYDKAVDGYVVKEEPYAYFSKTETHGTTITEVKVLDGEVFVMGDNRQISLDSRSSGAFLLSDVKGVVKEWVIENKDNLKWIYPYI